MTIGFFFYCIALIPMSIILALVAVAFVGMIIRLTVSPDNDLGWLAKHVFLWAFALVFLAGVWAWVTP